MRRIRYLKKTCCGSVTDDALRDLRQMEQQEQEIAPEILDKIMKAKYRPQHG